MSEATRPTKQRVLDEAMAFVAVLREHDPMAAKHPRQDYLLALGDHVLQLRRLCAQAINSLPCPLHEGLANALAKRYEAITGWSTLGVRSARNADETSEGAK